MSENKNKNLQAKKTSKKKDEIEDEIEELKVFIKKKKIQNEALKKIIEKLNTEENLTTNK